MTEGLRNKNYILLLIAAALQNIQIQLVNPIITKQSLSEGFGSEQSIFIFALFSVGSLCLRPFSGFVCNKIHLKYIIIFSSIIVSLSYVLYMLSFKNYVFLLILRFVQGGGFAFYTTALMNYISFFIPEDRMTKGMGFFGAGQILSVALGPFIALYLVDALSYNELFIAASLISFISGVLCFFVKREQKVKKVKGFFTKEAVPFAVFALILFLLNSIETGYIVVYLEEINTPFIPLYFLIVAILMMFSRFYLSNKWKDKGVNTVLLRGLLFIAISYTFLAVSGFNSLTLMLVFIAAAFKGIGHGVSQPTLQSGVVSTVEKEERGKAVATFYMGCDIGMAVGPIISAFISGDITLVFAISAVFAFVSAVSAYFFRPLKKEG